MTLETLYYISQIVAVLAILGSVIFVGVQIGQNTKQAEEAERVARGQVIQNISAENRQHSMVMLSYPEVYHCFVNGTDPADMSEDNRSRVAIYSFATLHMVQNIYFQHKNGLLDDQTYESYLPFLVSFLSTPAGQQYWTARRHHFDADFADMMDDQFRRADPLPPTVRDGSEDTDDGTPENQSGPAT